MTTMLKDRISITKPVKNLAGDVVANDAAGLFSGTILKPILFNERGKDAIKDYVEATDGPTGIGGAAAVWSGSKETGVYGAHYIPASNNGRFDCLGWTSNNANTTVVSNGNSGRIDKTDKTWLAGVFFVYEEHQCQRPKRIYCISQ